MRASCSLLLCFVLCGKWPGDSRERLPENVRYHDARLEMMLFTFSFLKWAINEMGLVRAHVINTDSFSGLTGGDRKANCFPIAGSTIKNNDFGRFNGLENWVWKKLCAMRKTLAYGFLIKVWTAVGGLKTSTTSFCNIFPLEASFAHTQRKHSPE